MRTSLIISNCLAILSLLNGAKGADTIGFAGMVVSPHVLASQAGQKILQSGGTAADAAVAVQMALNVVEPSSSGIGGGSFIIYYESDTQTVYSIDGSVEAPTAYNPYVFCSNETCFNNNDGEGVCNTCDTIPFSQRKIGGLGIGVPGTLAAFKRLWETFGDMEWMDLFADAIDIAGTSGFPMYQGLYDLIQQQIPFLSRFNATCQLLLNHPDCNAPKYAVGDTVLFPDLAATLTTLSSADSGILAFYTDAIAAAIVEQSQNAIHDTTLRGGLLATEDIQGYSAVFREPISIDFDGGISISGANMPSSSLTALMPTKYLNKLNALATDSPAEILHDLFSVQNVAAAARFQFFADQDFVDVPIEELLDDAYLQERVDDYLGMKKGLITDSDPIGFNWSISTGAQSGGTSEGGGTHFAIYDQWGNMASISSSIGSVFGSSVVLDGYGFLLNNALMGFSAQGTHNGIQEPNAPEGGKKVRQSAIDTKGFTDSTSSGGKRPRSALSPVIIFMDNEPYIALGAYGQDSDDGEALIGTTVNLIARLLVYNAGVQEAVDAPRVWGWNVEMVEYEKSLWEAIHPNITSDVVDNGIGYASSDFMDFSFGGGSVLLVHNDGLLYCGQDTSRWEKASCLAVCDDVESVCPYSITTAYPRSTQFDEETTTEAPEEEECVESFVLAVSVRVMLASEPTEKELQSFFKEAFKTVIGGTEEEWKDGWCFTVPLGTITITTNKITVSFEYNDELNEDTFLGNADKDTVNQFESEFAEDILEILVDEGFAQENTTISVDTLVSAVKEESGPTKLELVNFITIVSCIDVLIFLAVCVYLYTSFKVRWAERPEEETAEWKAARDTIVWFHLTIDVVQLLVLMEVIGTILHWVLVIYAIAVVHSYLGWIALVLVLCGDVLLVLQFTAYKKLIVYQIVKVDKEEVMKRKIDLCALGLLLAAVEDIPIGLIIAVVLGDEEGWNGVFVLVLIFSIISVLVKLVAVGGAMTEKEDDLQEKTTKEVELAETTTKADDGESKKDKKEDKEEETEEVKEDKEEVKVEPKEDEEPKKDVVEEEETKEDDKEEVDEEPKKDAKADGDKEDVKDETEKVGDGTGTDKTKVYVD